MLQLAGTLPPFWANSTAIGPQELDLSFNLLSGALHLACKCTGCVPDDLH